MSLAALLRCTGGSLLVLSLLHVVFWHTLRWKQELAAVTALTRRVFVVHTIVVAAMLFGLGMLSLLEPEIFILPSQWARLLLTGIVALWVARMLAQPLVFNPVMTDGWTASRAVQAGATLVWLAYALVYGAALTIQLGARESVVFAPGSPDSLAAWLRVAIAAVWITFGLIFKLLDAVPRHRYIVARVAGERWSRILTVGVAVGEIGLGLWMLQGQNRVACAAVQTTGIVAMNALELVYARDLLLAPRAMLSANALLLSLSWYVALA